MPEWHSPSLSTDQSNAPLPAMLCHTHTEQSQTNPTPVKPQNVTDLAHSLYLPNGPGVTGFNLNKLYSEYAGFTYIPVCIIVSAWNHSNVMKNR